MTLPSRGAIHEAAYAVAFAFFGIEVARVTVVTDGDYAGRVWPVRERHDRPTRVQALVEAIPCVAGGVAELLAFGDADGRRVSSSTPTSPTRSSGSRPSPSPTGGP